MVVARLMGGLGNQMFQYAAARALSLRLQTELRLDLTPYSYDRLRDYGLSPYRLQFKAANLFDRLRFKLVPGLAGATVFREPNPSEYDCTFESLSGNVFLDGFFQNVLYFQSAADSIREELTLTELSEEVREIAREISSVTSVSVHVRRGDYVTNPEVQELLPFCDRPYFEKAIEHIGEQLTEPVFFLFSDDLSWVSEHLQIPFPFKLVSGRSPQEDIYLMSQCSHHVIPNSTFSWWGAWLNPSPEKIVIGPDPWGLQSGVPFGPMLPEWQVLSR